jgi:hypothetical protein
MKNSSAILAMVAVLALSAAPVFAMTLTPGSVVSGSGNDITVGFGGSDLDIACSGAAANAAQGSSYFYSPGGSYYDSWGCEAGTLSDVSGYLASDLSPGTWTIKEIGCVSTDTLALYAVDVEVPDSESNIPDCYDEYNVAPSIPATIQLYTFNVTAAGVIVPGLVSTSAAPEIMASVGSTVKNQGVLEIVGLAVGIPLAFLIFHYLIGLVPSIRAHRKKYGEFG